ncbi:MAG TPA: DUF4386 domain-containing protein [Thermoanaerobaculia bacterium]|nr:DUF4386 domain-containing protein [Thermoanaerobaculia bacterium]
MGRMGGLFYLLMGVCGALATFARRGLIVKGDAAATAANIMTHQSRYLSAFAGDLLLVASYVVVTALFYRIFKPVNKTVALIAAFFGLTGCVVQGFALAFQLAPLTLLDGARYLGTFNTAQLQALAYAFLKFYSQAYGIALVFFGFFCLLTGYLIWKSTFLPRALGAFMMLAGLGGLAFLSPIFATAHLPYTLFGSVGELLLTLWLIAKGVDPEKWTLQNAAANRVDDS